MGDSDRYV